MCNLETPYEGFNLVKMMQKVYTKGARPKIVKSNPDILKALLPRMWDADIAQRPTMQEVLGELGKALSCLSGDDLLLDETNRTRASYDGNRS